MKRLHLLEIEDQAWCPAPVRDAGTAYLRFMQQQSGHASILARRLAEALRATGDTDLLDLCSGAGGPFPLLLDVLEQEGVRATATLTDRHPNVPALRHAAAGARGRVRVEEQPVDATAVPPELTGFRTLFNSFHHFRPRDARRILADAARAGRPIAVFELVGREPAMFFGILLAPLLSLLVMPFVPGRRWSWLFFTYLVPLVPLLILFDGLVSCLRVYSLPELSGLTQGLGGDGWRWEMGRLRLGSAPAHATFLVGLPARGAAGAAS